jgi:hypothetical protein
MRLGATDVRPRAGGLLSTTCTTGWLDWFHGQLWLFPDGLLRIPLGKVKTILFVGYATNPWQVMPRVFSEDKWRQALSHPGSLWVPFAGIRQANLRHVFSADEFSAQFWDGRSIQLLWLPRPMVYDVFEASLREWRWEQGANQE